MDNINLKDVDLNNAHFHFTLRENVDKIASEGLMPQRGGATQLKNDKQRIYVSRGYKGMLGIKNSFIFEFKQLRICDIPQDYRKYFNIEDFSSTEQLKEDDVYEAMEKRFKDEVYLLVDVKEGEDYRPEDVNGLAADLDIGLKENHTISPDKLHIIEANNSTSAYDVVKSVYDAFLSSAKKAGQEDIVRSFNDDLDAMFEYVRKKEKAKNEPMEIS